MSIQNAEREIQGLLAGVGFHLEKVSDGDDYEIRSRCDKKIVSGKLETMYYTAQKIAAEAKMDPAKYEAMNEPTNQNERYLAGLAMNEKLKKIGSCR